MSEYTTIEHYVNHVMDEITKRDVEQVSERLRALGWEEVVRCRDCKYAEIDHSDHEYHEPLWCGFHRMDVKPDNFCSFGERRDA